MPVLRSRNRWTQLLGFAVEEDGGKGGQDGCQVQHNKGGGHGGDHGVAVQHHGDSVRQGPACIKSGNPNEEVHKIVSVKPFAGLFILVGTNRGTQIKTQDLCLRPR